MAVDLSPASATDAERMARSNSVMAEELGLLIDGATNYAIYMLDPHGRVTIWNRGAERIKGWTEAEVIGGDFAIFYPPEDATAGKPLADLARANSLGRLEEECWQLRKDGSEFLASVTLTALHDDAGALRGFGRVVRDITDQTAANAAVLRREQHLRSILASVPDAMVVFNERGVVSSFSAAAERMFGFARDDVIERRIGMLIPSLEGFDATSSVAIDEDDNREVVCKHALPEQAVRNNGETFPIDFAVGHAVIAGERIFTGFVRDLTMRRQTERRVRELQSELVHVSRVSAMGTMAATLAHEINQPLTAIAAYLEATRAMIGDPDDALLAEVAQAIDLAAAQALRAGTLIRRLRAFVDGGETGFRPERVDTLIEEAISLGLLGAHEAGITVSMEIGAGGHLVMVDRVQIQQVVVNLIRNAIQSMETSARKDLTITTASEGAGWIEVTVADTGSGIDPEVRERLFEAFATTKEDGMGLGLSICRTIVEAHGGRIWASGARGGGTAFHFCLPMASNDDV